MQTSLFGSASGLYENRIQICDVGFIDGSSHRYSSNIFSCFVTLMKTELQKWDFKKIRDYEVEHVP